MQIVCILCILLLMKKESTKIYVIFDAFYQYYNKQSFYKKAMILLLAHFIVYIGSAQIVPFIESWVIHNVGLKMYLITQPAAEN